jgi:hypothetical protein
LDAISCAGDDGGGTHSMDRAQRSVRAWDTRTKRNRKKVGMPACRAGAVGMGRRVQKNGCFRGISIQTIFADKSASALTSHQFNVDKCSWRTALLYTLTGMKVGICVD